MTTSAGAATLACAAEQLRAAQTPARREQAARALLESTRRHCTGTVDITTLTEAVRALLEALATTPGESGRAALEAIAHEFIDLARLKTVRRAAYPADADRPGGRCLDLFIQLIERSNFTVGRMFRQRAAQFASKTLFIVPHGDHVVAYSWEQVARATEQIAGGVLAVLGDDARVAIFTPNRLEGALCDLACLTNGIFDTPVPANSTGPQLEHILFESGARLLFVSGGEQLQIALTAAEQLPALERIVTLDPLPTGRDARLLPLSELIERGQHLSAQVLEERVARVRATDLATTMYTSGTSGAPKGVKFSHLSLVSKRFARTTALPEIDETEVFLCYLPLYHTFGRYLEMLGAIHLAATYVFAENPSTETLIEHMQRLRPTAMISVPKKWLDLHRRVAAVVEDATNADDVRRELHRLTGGRLRWGLSAAGHLDPAVFRFFQGHGVDLLSGYGLTEATGGITMTPPGRYVDDSIGRALPAIEVAFGEDGELLLRGPYVTSGYTDPQDDVAAFRDGWFCTGDILSRDEVGYFRYVDRKKDIYKNASGRTVAPQRIEALFAGFPEVKRVFAVGDGREHVTLLISPNRECPEVPLAGMSDEFQHEYFRGLVASCNRFLAPFERVVNFALIDRDFLLEKGELTPKGSLRRAVVAENFRDVIEPMYASQRIEREVDGLHVKIPIAFLQHLGATEAGTRADNDGLVFYAIEPKSLRIHRERERPGRTWIGNCCYDVPGAVIDLDDWLRLPTLWIGNAELTHLSGESILLWSLAGDDRAVGASMVGVAPPTVPVEEWLHRLATAGEGAPSLLSVHAAAVGIWSSDRKVALRAIDHLAHVLAVGHVRHQELAEAHLQHAAEHGDVAVRGRAFVALLERQPLRNFGRSAARFCQALLPFLDDQACAQVARIGIEPARWRLFGQALAGLRRRVCEVTPPRASDFALALLPALGRIAAQRGDLYLSLRRELMTWLLAPVPKTVRRTVEQIIGQLTRSFRERLGPRQTRCTDAATGCAYTWNNVVQFEDGLEPEEFGRIADALHHSELVREAVYLLHGQKIDLSDLAPDSIWISLVGTRFGRSTYHVGVRLRSGERCDFSLYVRSTAPVDAFLTDLHLIGVAAGDSGEAALTPQLGGYYPEYGLASIEHVPGEPIEALVRHMHEHPDRDVRQRLRSAWRHLCWSALAAAFEFHRRTEGRWMLTGTVTRDISVPLHDYEEGARIYSVAGWSLFHSALDMLVRLQRAFLERARFQFPGLAAETPDEWLFDAALESLGLQAGLAFLTAALAEAQRTPARSAEADELAARLKAYVERVEQSGYMPKALHFAIARYQAWAQQVPEASVAARAAQLRQIQNNYRIAALVHRFPEARLWLFAETVLADSPEEGRRTIAQAIQSLRAGRDIRNVLGGLYASLQDKLPSYDQQYFLTRAAYPHVDLDQRAQLVLTTEVGPGRAELVTVHTDRTSRELRVRPPANSGEIDGLYRIFYGSGVGGGVSAHEEFLVVVDQAGYVVGGIAAIRRTPHHVLLDRIAVVPRCRGRGIGRLLLEEFLRREAAEGAAIVSAEFIRRDWLAQFDFHPDPRFAGVVRLLSPAAQPSPGAT